MNDPHVVALYYTLVLGPDVEYSPPSEALLFKKDGFRGTLQGTQLKLEPHAHFASRDEAIASAEPLVRNWTLEAAVRLRIPAFRLEYERTELVDRAPEPGRLSLYGEARGRTTASATARVVTPLNEYPPPPSDDFDVTPDVETLWRRYTGYMAGREPLLSMTYFAFTVLTTTAGGRANAASQFNIEEAVLRKLSELSSVRGDAMTARKAQQGQQPLAASEEAWLDQAVRAIILQMGRSNGGPPARPLLMSDLPTI